MLMTISGHGKPLLRAVCVFIASAFIPISLITAIVIDLRISEAQAGQVISIFRVFAC
ncbi:hypothetical protein LPH50_10340 [Xylella taiwanensis]|uniref:Uncharacterized protein n=1 Tax=Xylella taiwanensis TaxID=1444770 RepID=Z9JMN8_9GAMM|nr:hypothetical protein [Xylella taiwanensis]EWS79268.1 hypothetical protein AF72_01855 [Xylella taiwanensis]MCD8456328.1 hypothetical protein [Xylella taiwanensis]MCD8458737.1 hypothetical protein [Xylella taiwanensis]MCD8460871.1 hypothetical protein [Xylella taiwanensis]MCD8463069.1 hypothetical protein [Xylella taiwanensis]